MLRNFAMNDKDKCLLAEYVGTGLSPRQIKAIKKEAAALREYIEFLETL